MIRRFNYTGRRKIPRARVRIRIANDGPRRRFDAELALDGAPPMPSPLIREVVDS